jgi:hypothetical protein
MSVIDPRTEDPVIQPVRPRVKEKRGSTLLNAVLGVAVLLAVGGVAFATGRMTAPAAVAFPNGGPGGGNFPGGPGASPGFGGGNGPGGGFFGAGGLTLEGTVQSNTSDTLTILTTGGQTVEVSLPADTTYHAQAAASGGDVQVGATVQVQLDVRVGQGQGQGQGQIEASDVTIVP